MDGDILSKVTDVSPKLTDTGLQVSSAEEILEAVRRITSSLWARK